MGLRDKLLSLGVAVGTGVLTGGTSGAALAAIRFGTSALAPDAVEHMHPDTDGKGFRAAAGTILQAEQAAMGKEAFAEHCAMILAKAEVIQAHLNAEPTTAKSPGQLAYEKTRSSKVVPWSDLSEASHRAWENHAMDAGDDS